METHLSEIIGEEITIKSCCRTDSGVHALMHVSNFFVNKELKIPVEKLSEVVNNTLPGDMRCLKTEMVQECFNSRKDARLREYMYVIVNDNVKSPFYRHRAWTIHGELSVRRLRRALKKIQGTHDFASFCANPPGTENTVRTIIKVKVKKKGKKIFIFIRGYAFLHRMIRMLVGAAVEIAQKKQNPNRMLEAIALKSRKKNRYNTAPACGLYLYRITY